MDPPVIIHAIYYTLFCYAWTQSYSSDDYQKIYWFIYVIPSAIDTAFLIATIETNGGIIELFIICMAGFIMSAILFIANFIPPMFPIGLCFPEHRNIIFGHDAIFWFIYILFLIIYGILESFHNITIYLSFMLIFVAFIFHSFPNSLKYTDKIPKMLQNIMMIQFIAYISIWMHFESYLNILISWGFCLSVIIVKYPLFEIECDFNGKQRVYYNFITTRCCFVLNDENNNDKTENEMIDRCYCIIGDIVRDHQKNWIYLHKFIQMNKTHKLQHLSLLTSCSVSTMMTFPYQLILWYPCFLFIYSQIFGSNVIEYLCITMIHLGYIGFYYFWHSDFERKVPCKIALILIRMVHEEMKNNSKCYAMPKERALTEIYDSTFRAVKVILNCLHPDIGLIVAQYAISHWK